MFFFSVCQVLDSISEKIANEKFVLMIDFGKDFRFRKRTCVALSLRSSTNYSLSCSNGGELDLDIAAFRMLRLACSESASLSVTSVHNRQQNLVTFIRNNIVADTELDMPNTA